jgi:hypothetical protein
MKLLLILFFQNKEIIIDITFFFFKILYFIEISFSENIVKNYFLNNLLLNLCIKSFKKGSDFIID